MVADLTRVVETEAKLFGGLPLQRYLFLVYLTDKGRAARALIESLIAEAIPVAPTPWAIRQPRV